MPYLWLGLIITASVVLQSTVVSFFQVGNARPDLLLMVTVSAALISGRTSGVSVGFFSGLLWDLLTAQFFGLYTLAKLITGYTVGSFEKKVFKDNPLLPLVAIFLATIFHEIILYICALTLGIEAPFFLLIGKNVVPSAIYNCLLMPFVYFGMFSFRKLIWPLGRHTTEF